MRRRIAAILLAAIAVATVGLARERLEALEPPSGGGRELLYLPNGNYLRAMSLGNESLAASLVYLWSIQFYANYEREDRFRYVEHVYRDVITELDPHFVDAYWLGALILTIEKRDLDAGLGLLDKGFRENPEEWILPYLAGWEAERFGEHERAATYFKAAADAPGAPHQLRRLQAGMVARSGDLRAAIRLWQEVIDDPRADDSARGIARRQIRDLHVRVDLNDLREAIEAFRARHHRNPRGTDELVVEGLIATMPLDPDGRPYTYDRRTGDVGSPAGRVLGASR